MEGMQLLARHRFCHPTLLECLSGIRASRLSSSRMQGDVIPDKADRRKRHAVLERLHLSTLSIYLLISFPCFLSAAQLRSHSDAI